jgi:hypothetical protein
LAVLLLKVILAPLLIGLVTLAGRKWGPGISGWLLGIPVNSGPVLLFFVLEQGREFAAHAALGSLLGILAWAAFGLAYAWCCLRLPWWWSTLLGWAAYFAVAFLLMPIKVGDVWAFVGVCAALTLILVAFPSPPEQSAAVLHTPSELWLRMVTATAFIFVLTAAAQTLGPRASGLLSAFPAFTTILAVFNHRLDASAAVRVLKGVSAGLFTAASFFLVLALALARVGVVAAFLLAIVATLLVQAGSLVFVRRMA